MAVLPTGIGPVTGGYQIERSLRFNSADSAYLSRTFGTPTNQNVWSLSMWIKKTSIGAYSALFARSDEATLLEFLTDDTFVGYMNGSNIGGTTSVYRDPSSWYHFLFVCSASTAQTLYVNGTQVKTYTATNRFNASGVTHLIGARNGPSEYFNGYMTEINFIDGQAKTPSDFGETDSATGVWKPKAYTGTYGTNGFYLKFADNSNTTAATLGKDSSGNGNNWTPNNFSVTAGAGNDSLVDSPTAYGTDTGVGGEVRGNYCTLNPLAPPVWAGTNYALSNGNLAVTFGYQTAPSTFSVSSGKWYWEVNCTTNNGSGSNNTRIGIVPNPYGTGTPGDMTGSYAYTATGQKGASNVYTTYGASFTDGDIIGVALDLDNGTITFYKNGSSQGTAYTGISGSFYAMSGSGSSSGTVQSYNFGQRAFAYTAPSGFKALCTQNLPTPTIGATSTTQANDYFDATLYTGTGNDLAIVNSGGMAPDLVWVKVRNQAFSHNLNDIIRGTNNRLQSDTTNAAGTTGIVSFNSNGFTTRGASGELGANGNTYVAWQWKGGGTGVTNTAGTITSTVSASTTSGFSIVTYTGTGANATVGHGLGVAPSLIITKERNTAVGNWNSYHASLGRSAYISLNTTNASNTSSNYWGTADPTSTVFGLGTAGNNTNTTTYVAYCFAPVAGYSAFGSYTGNGSADGPFIYTGFKPNFVMVKQTNTSGNSWWMFDGVRSPTNAVYNRLAANLSDAEYSNSSTFDFLSNGFKLRFSDTAWNGSGSTYIYAAFAESPFKYSLAR